MDFTKMTIAELTARIASGNHAGIAAIVAATPRVAPMSADLVERIIF